MASMNKDSMNNDYRSAPSRPGPAHDEQSIGRMNMRNDNVSVVHSGESDPMPNAEAQEAYADDDMEDAGGLRADASNPSEHNPGADSITAIDDPNLELVGDVDEIPMEAHSGDPENPTAAAGSEVEDDENDFEYQQQLGEESGPVNASADDEDLRREEVA
ncbi:MAG: hypothetical protein EOP11_03375 [Proteobacteria bacterium]|nr:MAG: hypothetical protein EOP11_03375 [Pseudomonadota bacterium]